MTAEELKRLDDIKLVKQLSEKGLSLEDIAVLLKLPESTVSAYQQET